MYDSYVNCVRKVCNSPELINSFKSDLNYMSVLEHVSYDLGKQYLNCILNLSDITLNEIREFCEINDRIGNPIKYNFDFGLASPSSLRYIFHSYLILKHMKNLNLFNLGVVEIGGGYGGLYLALNYFSKKYDLLINNYTIIDFEEVCVLQKMYHKLNNITNVNYVKASTFGEFIENRDLFLISNYCFSEISGEYQQKYIEKLFSKVSHGFMCWNHIEPYHFGFDCKIEEEYPDTCHIPPKNKYIYF
jgi:hypothetical protein